ncbi:MAG TPA: transcription antitermination factor NusB [Polyangia bacterium]|jgi:N utilization substance protein B|nr:transcription antitermination factor NusB [Polyangia bacterium]
MVGPRRRSREVAVQVIYLMDASPELEAEAALNLYFTHLAADINEGEPGSEPERVGIDRAMVDDLVKGFASHRQELDELLATLSQNWRVERMAPVERNVIRLALYELKYCEGVPVSVALNEAVELAKRFGSSEGAAFVNGMLDRAVNDLGIRR